MKKHAWLVAIAALLGLSQGCGEVDSCREIDTPGCLNSAPRTDGTCLFDLVLSGGICVKHSVQDACSFCTPGALCVNQQCVDVCAAPDRVPNSIAPPGPIFCRATRDEAMPEANPMLSFEEVCKRKCLLAEREYQQFCPGYVVDPAKCEKEEVLATCNMQCPPLADTGGRDLACLTALCEDVRASQCDASLQCPNGAAVECTDITCTNDCEPVGGKSYVGDGHCDDGDVVSSETAECRWGSDCIDCGARRGPPQEALPLGSVCAYTANCAGATARLGTMGAWCVELETTGAARCVPDCSRGQECPVGFDCREVLFGDERQPIMDEGFTSRACIPQRCP